MAAGSGLPDRPAPPWRRQAGEYGGYEGVMGEQQDGVERGACQADLVEEAATEGWCGYW